MLTVSTPLTRTIEQRNVSDQVAFQISGSLDVAANQVQARFIPRSGATGTDTGWVVFATDTVFSGTVTVDAGWYDLYLRAYNGPYFVGESSVERVGVGDVFIIAGQSNAANAGQVAQVATSDLVNRVLFNGVWEHADDPQPTATSVNGSPWPLLADAIVALTGFPVGLISVAVGGSSITQWVVGGDEWVDKLLPAIQLFSDVGKRIRAILWHQGEYNAGTSMTQVEYEDCLKDAIDGSRAELGFDVTWGIVDTATWQGGGLQANSPNIQAAQDVVATTYPDCFAGADTDSLDDTYRFDGTHFNVLGLQTHATMWFNAIVNYFNW